MTRSELIYYRLMTCIHNGEVENSELIKIVQDISDILGLKTLTNYAKYEGISYPGAKKRKLEMVNISGINFIIDND
jgi:hypothetical protein